MSTSSAPTFGAASAAASTDSSSGGISAASSVAGSVQYAAIKRSGSAPLRRAATQPAGVQPAGDQRAGPDHHPHQKLMYQAGEVEKRFAHGSEDPEAVVAGRQTPNRGLGSPRLAPPASRAATGLIGDLGRKSGDPFSRGRAPQVADASKRDRPFTPPQHVSSQLAMNTQPPSSSPASGSLVAEAGGIPGPRSAGPVPQAETSTRRSSTPRRSPTPTATSPFGLYDVDNIGREAQNIRLYKGETMANFSQEILASPVVEWEKPALESARELGREAPNIRSLKGEIMAKFC